MARIKIIGRREPIEIDGTEARKIKKLRFGDIDGIGKLDPNHDIDLGDAWAGKIGQIDWIELDRTVQPTKTRWVTVLETKRAKMVSMDYTLQAGEEFI